LLGTEWWAYHPETIWKLGYTNPSEFCDKFDHAARSGEIVPHQYRQLTWRDVVDEIATAQAGLSPLQMAAEPSQLLTGHGTVVFADFEGQLHHGPLALSPANVLLAGDRQAAYLMHRGSDGVQRPMEVSPSAEFRQAYDIPSDGNARPGEFGVVGAQGSVFGLTRNGLFLCAELDGRITLSRRLLAQWERFDLLRCDDLPSPGGKGHATK
jgi:hypothetical protein